MYFTGLTERVGGKGSDAWEVHYAAIERQRQGADIVILSIGQEMIESTPDVIVEACYSSLKRGRHHYSEIGGEPDLREAIAKRFSDESGLTVSAANCAVLAGAQNALFAASLCTLQHGDEAIIMEPYYATYPATFSVGGADVTSINTRAEDDFMPRIDEVEKSISKRTRVIVVNSPHNPSGVVYDQDFMQAMVDICRSRNIWLISDEVYSCLLPPGSHHSPATLPDAFDCCITVSSLSKSHRMTGWRLGWIIASEPVIEKVFNLSTCMSYGLPMFIQDASVTALEHTDRIANAVRDEIDRKRNMVISRLGQIDGINIRGSRYGMFVIFEVRDLGISGIDFAWRLLDEYQVAALPCDAFGASAEGLIRINIGESESNLLTACERIRTLAQSLNSGSR
ncbi:MAG: pyridoxal phosphate-dependent aminotransferase [Acidiferrobacterales bacterium]|nr:pyridoxal phosphate-dependent aminotransferase [Acidiferrobacterales bacterium]